MHRIVFMGTPEFAVPPLQALLDTEQVVGVVTQPDRPAGRGQQMRQSPVKRVALAAGVPLYQPRSLRRPEAAERLREWAPDAIVVAAFGQILRPHVLALPPLGCINVHASLLPRWRGASPIQHALLAGDVKTGISLMKMDEGLDTGPVFVKESLLIHPEETAATLHDRLAALGGEMVLRHLEAILEGEIAPEPQDDELSTYASMIGKEDGQIDWRESSQQLDRHVRAMTPWPGAFTRWEGKRLIIHSARPVAGNLPAGKPGEVVDLEGTTVVLAGEGGLQLLEVQQAGRRATLIADFVRGRPEFIGSHLGG